MRDRYDVIVVGARVAGSTLAALLGDAGVSVLLLDRARFPSTTPSTHFFRGAGMVGVLRRATSSSASASTSISSRSCGSSAWRTSRRRSPAA